MRVPLLIASLFCLLPAAGPGATPTARKPDRIIKIADGEIGGIAWVDGPRRLLYCIEKRGIRLVHPLTGRKEAVFKDTGRDIWRIAVSPNRRRVAAAVRGGVAIWDVASGRRLRTLKVVVDHATSFAWSPDGRRLAVTIARDRKDSPTADFRIGIYEAAGGRRLREFKHPVHLIPVEGHGELLFQVAWSSDGRYLATGVNAPWTTGAGYIWHARSGKRLSSFGRTRFFGPGSIAWRPGAAQLAAVVAGEIRILSPKGRTLRRIRIGDLSLGPVSWSPNGATLAAIEREDLGLGAYAGKAVRLWSISGKQLRTLHYPRHALVEMARRPNGDEIAAATDDGQVVFWRMPQQVR